MTITQGRTIGRSHYDLIADRRTGLTLGDLVTLGRNTFVVVGMTEDLVASGGDPVVFMTLLDSQKLQFDLAPPAARIQTARGSGGAQPTP